MSLSESSSSCFRVPNGFNFEKFLRHQELGLKIPGTGDYLAAKLYSNLSTNTANKFIKVGRREKYGGIFNFEFSPQGQLLLAACEDKAVKIYDASNQRFIRAIPYGHFSSINCIKFMDDNSFATGSDDTFIKTWDLRQLHRPTRSLVGHTNWVKNIEYCKRDGLLVTSGFDGNVRTWDLRTNEQVIRHNEVVFHMNGLMRMKLTPDETKMIISTTAGYIILIHHLDLSTLPASVDKFTPDFYRLMQLTQQNFPYGNLFNCLFSPTMKTNRLEFIDDFPEKSEVVGSIEVHPHGWNVVSRSIDTEETESWMNVHDIQLRDPSDYYNSYTEVHEDLSKILARTDGKQPINSPCDLWMSSTTNLCNNQDRTRSLITQNPASITNSFNSGLIGTNTYKRYLRTNPICKDKIVKNLQRLTHSVSQSVDGRGYIKEISYSRDGRTICTPYGQGVRVYSFNESVNELSYCVPEKPQNLHLLRQINEHQDVVLCCKFSPVHTQLVSGCLSGDIKWYDPML